MARFFNLKGTEGNLDENVHVLFYSLVLYGCAGTSQVVPTGGDTYMVESHGTMGWSSGSAQEARAFQKANAFCESSGKEIEVISTDETPSGFGKIASG